MHTTADSSSDRNSAYGGSGCTSYTPTPGRLLELLTGCVLPYYPNASSGSQRSQLDAASQLSRSPPLALVALSPALRVYCEDEQPYRLAGAWWLSNYACEGMIATREAGVVDGDCNKSNSSSNHAGTRDSDSMSDHDSGRGGCVITVRPALQHEQECRARHGQRQAQYRLRLRAMLSTARDSSSGGHSDYRDDDDDGGDVEDEEDEDEDDPHSREAGQPVMTRASGHMALLPRQLTSTRLFAYLAGIPTTWIGYCATAAQSCAVDSLDAVGVPAALVEALEAGQGRRRWRPSTPTSNSTIGDDGNACPPPQQQQPGTAANERSHSASMTMCIAQLYLMCNNTESRLAYSVWWCRRRLAAVERHSRRRQEVIHAFQGRRSERLRRKGRRAAEAARTAARIAAFGERMSSCRATQSHNSNCNEEDEEDEEELCLDQVTDTQAMFICADLTYFSTVDRVSLQWGGDSSGRGGPTPTTPSPSSPFSWSVPLRDTTTPTAVDGLSHPHPHPQQQQQQHPRLLSYVFLNGAVTLAVERELHRERLEELAESAAVKARLAAISTAAAAAAVAAAELSNTGGGCGSDSDNTSGLLLPPPVISSPSSAIAGGGVGGGGGIATAESRIDLVPLLDDCDYDGEEEEAHDDQYSDDSSRSSGGDGSDSDGERRRRHHDGGGRRRPRRQPSGAFSWNGWKKNSAKAAAKAAVAASSSSASRPDSPYRRFFKHLTTALFRTTTALTAVHVRLELSHWLQQRSSELCSQLLLCNGIGGGDNINGNHCGDGVCLPAIAQAEVDAIRTWDAAWLPVLFPHARLLDLDGEGSGSVVAGSYAAATKIGSNSNSNSSGHHFAGGGGGGSFVPSGGGRVVFQSGPPSAPSSAGTSPNLRPAPAGAAAAGPDGSGSASASAGTAALATSLLTVSGLDGFAFLTRLFVRRCRVEQLPATLFLERGAAVGVGGGGSAESTADSGHHHHHRHHHQHQQQQQQQQQRQLNGLLPPRGGSRVFLARSASTASLSSLGHATTSTTTATTTVPNTNSPRARGGLLRHTRVDVLAAEVAYNTHSVSSTSGAPDHHHHNHQVQGKASLPVPTHASMPCQQRGLRELWLASCHGMRAEWVLPLPPNTNTAAADSVMINATSTSTSATTGVQPSSVQPARPTLRVLSITDMNMPAAAALRHLALTLSPEETEGEEEGGDSNHSNGNNAYDEEEGVARRKRATATTAALARPSLWAPCVTAALTHLDLSKTRTDSAALAAAWLPAATPLLTVLRLSGTDVSDVAPLAGLGCLEVLNLASSPIDKAGLALVQFFPRLRELYLTHCHALAEAEANDNIINGGGGAIAAAALLQVGWADRGNAQPQPPAVRNIFSFGAVDAAAAAVLVIARLKAACCDDDEELVDSRVNAAPPLPPHHHHRRQRQQRPLTALRVLRSGRTFPALRVLDLSSNRALTEHSLFPSFVIPIATATVTTKAAGGGGRVAATERPPLFPRLSRLLLLGTAVSQLGPLAGHCPRLRVLDASYTNVTAHGLWTQCELPAAVPRWGEGQQRQKGVSSLSPSMVLLDGAIPSPLRLRTLRLSGTLVRSLAPLRLRPPGPSLRAVYEQVYLPRQQQQRKQGPRSGYTAATSIGSSGAALYGSVSTAALLRSADFAHGANKFLCASSPRGAYADTIDSFMNASPPPSALPSTEAAAATTGDHETGAEARARQLLESESGRRHRGSTNSNRSLHTSSQEYYYRHAEQFSMQLTTGGGGGNEEQGEEEEATAMAGGINNAPAAARLRFGFADILSLEELILNEAPVTGAGLGAAFATVRTTTTTATDSNINISGGGPAYVASAGTGSLRTLSIRANNRLLGGPGNNSNINAPWWDDDEEENDGEAAAAAAAAHFRPPPLTDTQVVSLALALSSSSSSPPPRHSHDVTHTTHHSYSNEGEDSEGPHVHGLVLLLEANAATLMVLDAAATPIPLEVFIRSADRSRRLVDIFVPVFLSSDSIGGGGGARRRPGPGMEWLYDDDEDDDEEDEDDEEEEEEEEGYEDDWEEDVGDGEMGDCACRNEEEEEAASVPTTPAITTTTPPTTHRQLRRRIRAALGDRCSNFWFQFLCLPGSLVVPRVPLPLLRQLTLAYTPVSGFLDELVVHLREQSGRAVPRALRAAVALHTLQTDYASNNSTHHPHPRQRQHRREGPPFGGRAPVVPDDVVALAERCRRSVPALVARVIALLWGPLCEVV